MDLLVHLMHFCASCVSDGNAVPTTAGALGGAAAAAGGLGGLSGSGGAGDAGSGAGEGTRAGDGNIPTAHANAPGTNPTAHSGNGGSNANGPAAPTPSGDDPFVKTIGPDGTETATVTNPDGTKNVVITDPFGNQTFKSVASDGYTSTLTAKQNGTVTSSSGYPGQPAPSTTQGPGWVQTSTPLGVDSSSFVRSNGNGTVTTGVQWDDGTAVGTTVEGGGNPHTEIVPPI